MTKASKQVSEIDRLIELASNDSPRTAFLAEGPVQPVYSLSVEEQKEPRPSMWRVLLQLRVLLPYLAKVLPLVERGLLGTNITGHSAAKVDTSHLDRGIAGVEAAQRDVSGAIEAQTSEIKFLQEQLNWLGKSIEQDMLLHEELSGSLASLKKLVKIWAVAIAGLLVLLIALVALAVMARLVKAG